MPAITSSRPYLIRAVHAWLSDNGLTPQMVVAADVAGVSVPRQHVRDGQIVLNVSSSAVRGLHIGNDRVEFSARFGGVPFQVLVPVAAVLALVARENGVGMTFAPEPPGDEPPPAGGEPGGDGRGPNPRPSLRVVK